MWALQAQGRLRGDRQAGQFQCFSAGSPQTWASGCRQGQAGVGSVMMARGPKATGPPVAGAGRSIWHSCQLTWHTQRVEVLLQVLAEDTQGSALLHQSPATAMGQHSA